MAAATTLHAGRIDTITIRTPSEPLRVDVVRVVGYRASCRCGWRGSRHDRYGEARQDAREHRHTPEP